MLLCKGKECIWRHVCSRYVLGQSVASYQGCDDTWIDHCLHASKFHRMNGAKDEECPAEKDKK